MSDETALAIAWRSTRRYQLLLEAIAMSLRNDVAMMVALIAVPGDDIVPLSEKADLRLRTQQTIELLDAIDAALPTRG
jgi:hypothetical protein